MMTLPSYLEGLNPAQLQAALALDGPLLIVAGPGSGKTRVIVHRIAHLILAHGVPPWGVLAVTFTNKAAREMHERIERLLGHAADGLAVGTFHAQCVRILRRDGSAIGIDPHFAIYDDNDQIDLLRRVLREMGIDEKRFAPRSFLNAISAAKSELVDPEGYAARAEGGWQELVSSVYRRYAESLTANGALDFDDLLGETVRLFREEPRVLDRYRDRYRYLLVDEFQDTNLAQYRLVRMLGEKHRNVCVVGDEDQGVYSWRQADIRNLIYFEQDFPELKVVLLEQNYRSTQTILDVARAVIAPNRMRKEKKLWTENDQGRPIVVYEAWNEEDEAQFVIREIERLGRAEHMRYREVAVMYRVNAQSRALEDALVRRGVPYRLVGGTRFYERKEVKDVLAYLRFTQNPRDTLSLARVINVPVRGLGEKTIAEVQRWAERAGLSFMEGLEAIADEHDVDLGTPVLQARARGAVRGFVELVRKFRAGREELNSLELLDLVLEASNYEGYVRDGSERGEDRWENVMELRTKAADFADLAPPLGLAAFLEEVALVQDVDSYDPEAEGVTLITLHAAKGLEFPFVFIVGMEEGLCPHSRSMNDPMEMEEERRLVYVGITRAMRGVYLVHAARRTLYGISMNNEPSRFLGDVPPELVDGSGGRAAGVGGRVPGGQVPVSRYPSTDRAAGQRYFPGDRVYHPAFGKGVVVTSLVHRGDEEVTVAFEGKGVKKIATSFSPLERA